MHLYQLIRNSNINTNFNLNFFTFYQFAPLSVRSVHDVPYYGGLHLQPQPLFIKISVLVK